MSNKSTDYDEEILQLLNTLIHGDILETSEEELRSRLIRDGKDPEAIINNTRNTLLSSMKVYNEMKNNGRQKSVDLRSVPKISTGAQVYKPEVLITQMAASSGENLSQTAHEPVVDLSNRLSRVGTLTINGLETTFYEGQGGSTYIQIDTKPSPTALLIESVVHNLRPVQRFEGYFLVSEFQISEAIRIVFSEDPNISYA